MLVKNLMTKNPIKLDKSATVNEALSFMEKKKIRQVVIFDGKKMLGIVTLHGIVTRDIPLYTKISNFVINTPRIEASEKAETAAELILRSGVHAIPVMEKGNLVGIITGSDLLCLVKSNKTVSEIAVPCESVTASDRMGKAIDIMTNLNVSRVPVVEKGELVGVVRTLDLIKFLRGRERVGSKGRLGDEKLRLEETQVRTIMSKPVSLAKEATLSDAAKIMKRGGEAFVSNGEMLILTPKDILEVQIGVSHRGVFVEISNLGNEKETVIEKMHSSTEEFVKKIGKMIHGLEYLFIHVERHKKSGSRMKYSVRARLHTPLGLFVSHTWGWDLASVTQNAMDRLEKVIIKKYERSKDRRKRR